MTDPQPLPAPRQGGKASAPGNERSHMDGPDPLATGDQSGDHEGYDWDEEDDAAIGGAWDAYRRRMHPDPDDPEPPELLTAEWWWRPPGVEIDLQSLKQAFHVAHHPDAVVYASIDHVFRAHPERRAAVPAYAQWIFPRMADSLEQGRRRQEALKREEMQRRLHPDPDDPAPAELLTAKWWKQQAGVKVDVQSLRQSFGVTHLAEDWLFAAIESLFRSYPERRDAVPASAQWIFPMMKDAQDRGDRQAEAYEVEYARQASRRAKQPGR